MPIALMIGGAALSYATYLWWVNELGGFIGRNAKDIGLACLLKAGTGDCAQLWFIGMHSTNQFASLAFYAGIGAIIAGIILLVPNSY